MKVTDRRKGSAFLATLTSALLVASGLALAPTAAIAAPQATEGTVSEASLDWGVKESFRKYIYGFPVFKGKSTLLGNAQQATPKGTFQWSGGTGTAAVDGSAADVSFGVGNGVHFQSHPMTVEGQEVYSLDMTFTNPHVIVTSATTGELRMDVEGREFIDMTSIGAAYSYTDAVIATLALPAPTATEGVLTWTDAAATLTEQGEQAFGEFYGVGTELDPVTFSLPVSVPVAPTTTATVLSASAENAVVGDNVSLKAAVTPAAEGTVQFAVNGTALSQPVPVAAGTATLSATDLTAGTHEITATFTPTDATLFTGSTSNTVSVKLTAPERQPASVTVSKTTGIDPDGETVTVKGQGFLPDAPATDGTRRPLQGKFSGSYVVFGSFAKQWEPSTGAPSSARVQLDTKWAVHSADVATVGEAAGGFELAADGTFETTLKLSKDEAKELESGRYGIYTYSGSGASYAGFETYTPVTFAVPAQATSVKLAASSATLMSGNQLTLTATVTEGVAGSVQFKQGDTPLGEPVVVTDNTAVLKTNKLVTVGETSVTATFTPSNAEAYTVSESAAVSIEVTERPTPTVTVEKVAGINPAGESVKVTGTGFLPQAPITDGKYPPFAGRFSGTYVVFGSFAEKWQPSSGAPSSTRKSLDTKWAVQTAELAEISSMPGAIELNADGTFETKLKLSKDSAQALKDGRYGVYTYGGGGVSYAPFETYTAIEFAPAAATGVSLEVAPDDVYAGDKVELTATVEGGASGSVQFRSNGAELGEPVKVVAGKAAFAATTLAAGPHSLTAEFLPDNADAFDGSTSNAVAVSVAAQPTVEINGKPAGKATVNPGEALALKFGPFVADQEFDVEIHSDVVVLPEVFVAGSDGYVNATWTVPADFELGAHSIVITDRESGRAFTFANAFTVEKVGTVGGKPGDGGSKAGGTPGADKTGQGSKSLASTGAIPAAAGFAVAGGLLALGALLLLTRRRQVTSAE